jgi:hypothetical protein
VPVLGQPAAKDRYIDQNQRQTQSLSSTSIGLTLHLLLASPMILSQTLKVSTVAELTTPAVNNLFASSLAKCGSNSICTSLNLRYLALLQSDPVIKFQHYAHAWDAAIAAGGMTSAHIPSPHAHVPEPPPAPAPAVKLHRSNDEGAPREGGDVLRLQRNLANEYAFVLHGACFRIELCTRGCQPLVPTRSHVKLLQACDQ